MDEEKRNINNEEITSLDSKTKEGSVGPIIGSIIVIILIILGGIYFLTAIQTSSEIPNQPQESEQQSVIDLADQEIDQEVSQIEAEVENLDFDEIDKELEQIEAELDAELENL